eukprot:TRINITY_DN18707_c0_g1_i5.p1 TRINITY_DN18707_c0_g1~~TRINITY_DN18707_c0_g1_i5.p1  ORF type:complete len:918 (-),score=98.31 TRINITY_DN18707_c0_g1_i5:25-2778(-)
MPRPSTRAQDGQQSSAEGLSQQQLLKLVLELDDPALIWLCDELLSRCSWIFRSRLRKLESDLSEDATAATITGETSITIENSSECPTGMKDSVQPDVVMAMAAEENKCEDFTESMGQVRIEEENAVELVHAMPDPDELAEDLTQRIAARNRSVDRPDNLLPTVAFEAPIHHCWEDETSVAIGVIRIGPEKSCQHRSEVKYCTNEGSAIAGVKFVPATGTLVFEAGERRKCIDVPIIDNEHWDCTLEFEVELMREGMKSARLSSHAHSTRVKILDNDAFPTRKFQKRLLSEAGPRDVNKFLLMIEYFRMNIKNPTVWHGTVKTLLSDTMRNLAFVMNLFLDMWMVDYVLCSDESKCPPSSVPSSLILIVLLKAMTFPLDHYLRYRKEFWKVCGASRMLLQSNLLRKYLSYDEKSLSEVKASRLILAMTKDSPALVEQGFNQVPKLVRILVRLALIVLYQLFVPVALGTTLSAGVIVQRLMPVILFPLAIGAFLLARLGTTIIYLDLQHDALNNMVYEIQETIANSRLISDYLKRSLFIDRIADNISKYNVAAVNASAVSTNNKYFSQWCTLLALSLYIPFAGIQVASEDGTLLLGTFLNNVAVIKALGDLFQQFYFVILEIVKTFDALTTVIHFMNLPIETGLRALQQKEAVAACRLRVSQTLKDSAECPIDGLCIEMRNLSFVYNKKGHIGSELRSCTCVLPQGGLYTFVGPPSEGKGTILKLLGGVLLPYHEGFERSAAGGGGTLMVPSHLRVIHVSKDPMFVQGTLLENLTFGCIKDGRENQIERVLEVCKECQIPEHLMRTIRENQLRCEWLDMLSGTESACLHVARAFIANPEVLIIHKPALSLNADMTDMMYNLLQKFVHQRGLGMGSEDFHSRRPRTCIVSARRAAGTGARVADAVFMYSSSTGLMHQTLT